MNPWIKASAAVFLAVGTLGSAFTAAAGEKVQKITFIEDDAQKNMASKIYTLKYTKAADVAPFVRSAVVRYCKESHVSTLNDKANKRQLMIVSTGIKMIPYVDKIVAALDRNAKFDKYSNITGNGIAVGIYQPVFRAVPDMVNIIVDGGVSSSTKDSTVRFDAERNMFYFKDTPYKVEDIKKKLAWLDKAVPQSRIELAVYEVRDSDLKDIGIDYLAWKNGPGLNLFSAGYNAVNFRAAERVIEYLVERGIDLAGASSFGFGGFYTAPAFDMSFIRLLQQNGKAIISSTASLLISNGSRKDFSVSFAPEYQNIEKNDKHATSVTIGKDASLTATISDSFITAGKNGSVNMRFDLVNRNVVERNNMGSELAEQDNINGYVSLPFNKEQILAVWERSATVEQTVGVPFLCEVPVLKYIFGTTTANTEVTRIIVTARAVPVVYNENIAPGAVAEFNAVIKSGKENKAAKSNKKVQK